MLKLLRPEVMTLLLLQNFTGSDQVKYHGVEQKNTAQQLKHLTEMKSQLLGVTKAGYQCVQLVNA